jgi:hypothetical protein
MRNILLSIMLPAVLSVLTAVPSAQAKEVKLSGLHSAGAVRAACAGVGGTSWSTSGRYGCINGSKGTSVTCTPGGECTGEVPGRVKPSGFGVVGVLTGTIVKEGGLSAPGILNGPDGFGAQGPAATSGSGGMPKPSGGSGGVIIR